MTNDNSYAKPRDGARGVTFDAGLRAHMLSVYNRMTLGVFVTAMTSWVVANSPALMKLFLGGPQAYLVMFAPLIVLMLGFRPDRMKSSTLGISFFALSVLYGISFSVIFIAYAGTDIARAFFIATSMFAGLSIFGYTTKKDLGPFGTFIVMGIWGLLAASILGIFFHSPLLQNVIAGVGIIVFGGMTAWQTQATKEMYSPSHNEELSSRMRWAAALNLYISFIAMFQYILHFTSQR